jgi:predicted deacylase
MKSLQLALSVSIAFLLAVPAGAADAQPPVLSSYLVRGASHAELGLLSSFFDIERRGADLYEVVVPEAQADRLLALYPRAQLSERDIRAALLDTLAHSLFGGAEYHTFDQVTAHLKSLAELHPDHVQLVEYGKSAQGRPLYALKLARAAKQDAELPELMLTAATHGDELITTEVLLALMDQLVEGYGKDARLTAMVDRHEIWFIPVVNADGFASRSRYDGGLHDPNRSYPWPGKPEAKATPSIDALIRFFQSRPIRGSVDLHAYGQLTMYPWAWTVKDVDEPVRTEFDELAHRMAATNGYEPGPIATTIYVAPGSSADYYFWKRNTLAMAIEIGDRKVPPADQIPAITREMTESMWLFIEHF